jgi:hypothetical protein
MLLMLLILEPLCSRSSAVHALQAYSLWVHCSLNMLSFMHFPQATRTQLARLLLYLCSSAATCSRKSCSYLARAAPDSHKDG